MPRHDWQEFFPQRGGAFPSESDVRGPDDVSAFGQQMNDKAFRLALYGVLYGLVGVIMVLVNLSGPSASDIGRLRINMTAAQVLQTRLGQPSSINRQVRADDVAEQWVYSKARGWLVLGFRNGRLTEIHDQQTAQ